uniref:Neurotransmitter-gated ion-channel ligand-binding domain-containing protein n=1 Tax=Anopheles atroparvus TaxID=41427 RepID=A0AAG5D7K3_ANOAO
MGKSCSNLWYIYAALLCFLVIALEHVSAQGDAPPKWTPTWTDRLKKDLLKGYDPSIRPSQHYNVTTVETSMTITHVEINEIKSTLSVYGWMKFIWNDTRLAWNPELYENKTNLYLNQSAIWHPTEESNVLVTVASNGEVQHAIALQKESKCSIQWEKWPFDTQHCKMLFSPWIEHEDMEIHVVLMKHQVTQGTLWTLMNLTLVSYHSDDGNASLAQRGTYLHLEMKRNSSVYRSTIIAPALVLILMNLINFWLPPNCSEKLVLNAINVLVACMFLIHFNEYLSYYTTTTPTIVLFYSHSLYLSGICLLMTVALECMLKTGSKSHVPPVIKKLLSHDAIACMIVTNRHRTEPNDQMCDSLEDTSAQESVSYMEEVHSSDQNTSDLYRDWLLFATLLNRVAFIIYVIIFSLMCIFYF